MEDKKYEGALPEKEGKEEISMPLQEGADAPEQIAPIDQEAQPTQEVPAVAEPLVDWSFDQTESEAPAPEPKPEKTLGKGGFFAVFGAVVTACILLLFVTLWVGDEGFQLIRNLRTERVVYVREDDGTNGPLSPYEAADKVKKSFVTISVKTETGSGLGSGFVYSEEGYICTNYHVIEGVDEVQVILPDGKAYDAAVTGYNAAADVAVLKIEAQGLVAAELGSSADLLVGERVLAMGTPQKLDYAGTTTFGNVSCASRLVPLYNTAGTVYKKMTLIQTDTSVNPGNSGGPLADMYGRVVGVVVMKLSDTTYEGIGFALPIDGVKVIADAIIEGGSFEGRNPIAEGRSLLGVTGHGVLAEKWYGTETSTGKILESDTQKAGYYYAAVAGVYVTEVNGGNAVGKLQSGDIILSVNGLSMRNTYDLIGEVNRHYAGETVSIRVYRNGAELDLNVILYEEDLT